MNKQEKIIVVILVALLAGWLWRQNRIAPETTPRAPRPSEPQAAGTYDNEAAEIREDSIVRSRPPVTPVRIAEPSVGSSQPETCITDVVDGFNVEFTSRGGIKSITLEEYPATIDPLSPPLVFHFSNAPALMIDGVFGPEDTAEFTIESIENQNGVILRKQSADGSLAVERRITIEKPYLLRCRESWINQSPSTLLLPTNRVWLGRMPRGTGESKTDILGVDVMHAIEPRKVEHWESKLLPGLFGASGGGCFGGGVRPGMPSAAEGGQMLPTDWIAVKNKFFAQSLRAGSLADGVNVSAFRNRLARSFQLESIRSALVFEPRALKSGDTLERELFFYVGPKKLNRLRDLGHGQDEIMQFGFFKWLCKILLPTLNGFYRVIPNYGVAIILLTLLVRIIFWPLTHRGTESMKKMQLLQPQLKELQKKFKDEPQKLQQETWKIYRENKVNPMASCLPMLIQIPVFIALFTVLRSAVELRFASFLWIRDLSEPENLLAGVLPLPLNILPLLMTATMIWQQKLTPSTGDPQQKRMMMFMPIMMLVMFYSMPSALVLYWTVSQLIAIAQLMRQRRKAAAESAAAAPSPNPDSERMTRQMRRRLEKGPDSARNPEAEEPR